jgi:ABC-type transport system involved in cytochrome bd biosynthesis fused ATPase/permease subunit
MHADKILVLHEGQVVQEGDHHELSSREGIYRNLCEIQGAIQDQIEADITGSKLATPSW